MNIALPSKVRNNKSGFEWFVELYAQTEHYWLEDIEIDMQITYWFDADMCAGLGAILYLLRDNLNSVQFIYMRPEVENILSKNGFLSHYGRKEISDIWGTTIEYKRFDVEDERYFSEYIEQQLINRSEIPQISPGLSKKFQESIFEIFSNAVLHSRTQSGIFSCGQFYPKKIN